MSELGEPLVWCTSRASPMDSGDNHLRENQEKDKFEGQSKQLIDSVAVDASCKIFEDYRGKSAVGGAPCLVAGSSAVCLGTRVWYVGACVTARAVALAAVVKETEPQMPAGLQHAPKPQRLCTRVGGLTPIDPR